MVFFVENMNGGSSLEMDVFPGMISSSPSTQSVSKVIAMDPEYEQAFALGQVHSEFICAPNILKCLQNN